MLLKKDNIVTNQSDEFIIDIYKSNGWEEVVETPKVEPEKEETKKVDESDKNQLQNKKRKK